MTKLRIAFAGSVIVAVLAACSWDPSRPFDREAPQVNEALGYYDAGEAGSAASLLTEYLSTGVCKEGNIGLPLRVRERPQGSFDLGLALFKIAEKYGHRFGDEENDAGFLDPNLGTLRTAQVDCALKVVRAIAEDSAQPVNLRTRARYLEGNLLFLTADYKAAVTAYDAALELAPGMTDAGPLGADLDSGKRSYMPDPVGRDAAWNRAVALRRIEDKRDAGQPDASPPDGGQNGDGGQNQNPDGGKDDNKDAGKDGGGDNKDQNKDAGGDKDKDSGNDNQNKPPPKDEPDAGSTPPPPPQSRQSQDDRILDQLENAPTVQQEAAKKHAKQHKVKGTADK